MLIEIKDKAGEVIFSLDKENNTFKETLEEAVKQGISLMSSDLSGADLIGADLSNACLIGADLNGANLRGVNLRDANLRDADLNGANLRDADLSGANLHSANLRGVILYNSILTGACISNANLSNADLRGTRNMSDLPMVCPSEGSFTGWKKIWDYEGDYKGEFIVKLEIPEDAKRSSATGNKCRCSKAKVLEIRGADTDKCVDEITNTNKRPCVYKVGEMVYPDSFDENRWNECSNGIHFFMTEQEAKEY